MSRWKDTEERIPSGVTGLRAIDVCGEGADLSDCLVERPRPFRLVIWEPLLTKAPGPARAQPHCCYIRTVIFYARPYIRQLRKSHWRDRHGNLKTSDGGFEEYDQIETRLSWDDVVEFENERFGVSGGRVRWACASGGYSRWWIVRGARRLEAR